MYRNLVLIKHSIAPFAGGWTVGLLAFAILGIL
jgi:hypothetical protein